LKVTRVTILDVEPSHICIYIVDVTSVHVPSYRSNVTSQTVKLTIPSSAKT
jgi:hypothetical protein